MQEYSIRRASEHDIPLLGPIERSAGQLFRTVGLDSLANGETLPQAVLRTCFERQLLWVAYETDSESRSPVAFLGAKLLESESVDAIFLHVVEVSVHMDHQRKGLARSLLHEVEDEARKANSHLSFYPSSQSALSSIEAKATSSPEERRLKRITGLSLTTYRHLDFNAKFYAKMGFVEISIDEIKQTLGTEAKQIWDEEQAQIPLPEERCWMVKLLAINTTRIAGED